MKAFEKWLMEDSKESGWLYDAYAEKQRKKGWRAALEAVLTQLDDIYAGDFGNSDIVDWINKELEEQGG